MSVTPLRPYSNTAVLCRAVQRVSLGEEETFLRDKIAEHRGEIARLGREIETFEALLAMTIAMRRPAAGVTARMDGSD